MLDEELFRELDKEIAKCIRLRRTKSEYLDRLHNELENKAFEYVIEPHPPYALWVEPTPSQRIVRNDSPNKDKLEEYMSQIQKLRNGELFINPTTVICSRSDEETDDFVIVDGKYVSRTMLTDHDFYCHYCQEYHNEEFTDKFETIDHTYVCERVSRNNFLRCTQCGLHFQRGTGNYYGSDIMCNSCYGRVAKYQIRGYHHSPNLIGYDYDKETGKNVQVPMENFKGYGIELEIDSAGESNVTSKDVIQLLDEEVYTMHDGSLNNGFEIVTHPHTEDALYNMNWADTFKWLLKKGYRSHDVSTCGLHMHISRKLFKDNEAICKMMYFYEKFRNHIVKLSRRTSDRVDRWAGFYSMPHRLTKSYIIDCFNAYNCGGHSCRYKCVNLTNSNTIEIRIMRGTLKIETFLATLDFIITVAKNANKISWEDIDNQELWLKGLKDSTVDYLISRRAFIGDTSQNASNTAQAESNIQVTDEEIETIKFRLEEINKQCV